MNGWADWVWFGVAMVGAVALIVLIIYAIFTLREVRRSLRSADLLMRQSQGLVENVDRKLHSFDPLFETLSDRCSEEKGRVAAILTLAAEWVYLGMALWKKMKRG